MVLIEDHLGDFRSENILDHSDRLACLSFPDLDILLSGHENLESFLAEKHLADSLIISIVRDEGPRVLEDSELTGAADQPSVLGYGSDAFDLNVGICDIESLNAAVIEDVPDLDHALGVSSYETVETRKAIDTDKRMLVTVESHDRFNQVRVPDEDIEVETARDKNLVLITVSHLSDSTFMTYKCLDGRDRHVAEDLLAHGMFSEVRRDLNPHLLLRGELFGIRVADSSGGAFLVLTALNLFLTKVP